MAIHGRLRLDIEGGALVPRGPSVLAQTKRQIHQAYAHTVHGAVQLIAGYLQFDNGLLFRLAKQIPAKDDGVIGAHEHGQHVCRFHRAIPRRYGNGSPGKVTDAVGAELANRYRDHGLRARGQPRRQDLFDKFRRG